MTLLDAARAWYAAGCSVLPIALDGTKRPLGAWKELQTMRMHPAGVEQTFAGDVGIAVATGAASGNLEMLEVEGPVERAAAVVQQLADAAAGAGLGELWAAVAGGYAEQSPKGGVHLFYRVTGGPVAGNVKLARRPKPEAEWNAEERQRVADAVAAGRRAPIIVDTIIETRGQGGYVIVAPTPAAGSDPAGPRGQQPWVAFPGKHPDMIATITAEQRDELHRLCSVFDEMSRAAVELHAPAGGPALHGPAAGGDRPGDVFAAGTHWDHIIGVHGWRKAYGPDGHGKTYWTRPGKRHGISATTTDDGPGGLWVFSSSTTFEPEQLYTKFGAYAHLEHGDDLSAAASALAGQQRPADTPMTPAPAPEASGAGPADSPPVPGVPGAPAANPGPDGPRAPDGGSSGTHPVSVAPGAPSWRPLDLTAYLDGSYTPPPTELFPRNDGVCLLYRSKTHSFFGESESGKSMLVQAEIARLLRDTDEWAAYVDYEDDAPAVVARLVALGAPREAIATRFHYIKPTSTPYASGEAEEFRALLGRRYGIIALDGVTTALGHMGDPKGDPNAHVTSWARKVLDPLAYWTGAAVVVIDHQGKNADARGRFQRGASAKMDVLSGAAYIVEPSGRMPIGRGLCGELVVRIAKDRPGAVRPHCGPRRNEDRTQEAARVVVDSRDDGNRIIVTVGPQQTGDVSKAGEEHDKRAARSNELMESISRYLGMVGGASARQVRSAVTGNTDEKIDALRALVAGGFVSETPNRGKGGGFRYANVRPYVAPAIVASGNGEVLDPQNGHSAPVEATGPELVPTGPELVPTGPEVPVPSLSPTGPGTGPTGSPVGGAGTGTSWGDGKQDQKQEHPTPPTVQLVPDHPTPADQPAAPVGAFQAPPPLVAPADIVDTGPLTRRRRDSVLCQRPGCREILDPMLVAAGLTRHYGCEEGS